MLIVMMGRFSSFRFFRVFLVPLLARVYPHVDLEVVPEFTPVVHSLAGDVP